MIAKYLEATERFADSPAHAYLLAEAGHAAYAVASTAAFEKNYVRFNEFSKRAEKYFRAALDTSQLSVQEPTRTALRRVLGEREKRAKSR